jgi:hypothetical protein
MIMVNIITTSRQQGTDCCAVHIPLFSHQPRLRLRGFACAGYGSMPWRCITVTGHLSDQSIVSSEAHLLVGIC